MSTRRAELVLWLCLACMAGGCAKGQSPANARSQEVPLRKLQPQEITGTLTSFSDQYLMAMAETYDRAQQAATTSQARIEARRLKLLAATGAISNAVDPNPLVGLMDMAMMVTLTRQIAQEPWSAEMFGKEPAAEIVAVLEIQEANIWKLTASYLSQAQIDELHQLAARWRQAHPEQRYVAGARLAYFPEAKGGGGGLGGGALAIAGSVFGLVTLDPFHGLDPAVKEVAESRVMAERMFFYIRHLPVLASWQTDQLFNQMLADPQMVQLFADTTTVAGSTTRFTDATSRFSQASSRLADTVEHFRAQLPDQQTKLVAELNDVIARQRDGALQQATTQVSVQRDAAIQQLNASVGAQQDLMTRNLQNVTDASIDRLYQRSRSLVLITVGSILLAFFIYRRFIASRSDKRVGEKIDGARHRTPSTP